MCPPICGAQMIINLMYVNNIHNFIYLSSIVLSFIHNFFMMISYIYKQLTYWSSSLKTKYMREKLQRKDHIRAIQEEIAGFLRTEVICLTEE
jgi:hypothetical protein